MLLVYTERQFSHLTGKAIEMTKMARIPLNPSQNTHYKFEIEVTHLIDLDPGLFPFSPRSHSDFYSIRRIYDEPLLE